MCLVCLGDSCRDIRLDWWLMYKVWVWLEWKSLFFCIGKWDFCMKRGECC